MNMAYLILGIALLAFGRKLFWLFVGCLGFVVGLQAAQLHFGLQPAWVAWAAGALLGLVGALLALFFQKVAIVAGGFAAGYTIAAYLTMVAGFKAVLLIEVIGGAIGAILLYILFDWALIGLSAVAGATLVVQALNWQLRVENVLYVALIAAGIIFQSALFIKKSSGPKPPPSAGK